MAMIRLNRRDVDILEKRLRFLRRRVADAREHGRTLSWDVSEIRALERAIAALGGRKEGEK